MKSLNTASVLAESRALIACTSVRVLLLYDDSGKYERLIFDNRSQIIAPSSTNAFFSAQNSAKIFVEYIGKALLNFRSFSSR